MIDRYTKFLLTVIAASLVLIILRDVPIVRQALAQSASYKGDTIAVTIRGIDECSSCQWEPLPVRPVR
jgi:hypothetical protein